MPPVRRPLTLGPAVAPDGTIFLADSGNHLIRIIATNGIVSDANNFTLRRVSAAEVVTTIAGAPGQDGSADGPAASARFGKPAELALAPNGTLYIADAAQHTIRRLTPDGHVSTVAGLVGADGANGLARFFNPYGLAIAARGHLVVADTYNQTVRELLAPFAVGVAASGNGRIVVWEAVVGMSYQAQFIDGLAAQVWQNLSPPISASSTTVSVIDFSSPGSSSSSFYRILRID